MQHHRYQSITAIATLLGPPAQTRINRHWPARLLIWANAGEWRRRRHRRNKVATKYFDHRAND